MRLADLPVHQLLGRFSSSEPTPGGGSASALAAATGASLLIMVAGLQKTRNGSDDDRAALGAAAAALDGIRRQLTDAIDADAAAYDEVVGAYKLPKATPEEQGARKAAIQRALQAATDVPLGVMKQSVRALEEATIVAAHGYKSAASDVGVAIALLTAGATGAKLNVDANVEAITDAVYRTRVGADSRDLLAATATIAERAEALLRP
jgi:formiminotetrahydrofolate cyclodeaminase